MPNASTIPLCSAILGIVATAATGCTSGQVSEGEPTSQCIAHYAAFRRPLEVAVVLDRSCAMQARFDGTMASGPTDPEGRWGAVRAALEAAGLDPSVAGWSIVFSPDHPAMCTHGGELALFAEPYSGELIPEVLGAEGASPFELCASGTSEVPLEAALGVINGSDEIATSSDPLVLVIAAGAPSCGATMLSLEDAAANTPFELAVLALAPDDTAASLLESLVLSDEEGARPGYHEAASAAEVDATLQDILQARQSCVLDLVSQADVPVTDEAELFVWVDGEPVAPDPEEGWILSVDGSITFNGTICERLRAGEVTRVDAAVGCDERRCVAIDPDDEGQGEESCDGLDNDCDDVVDEDCF